MGIEDIPGLLGEIRKRVSAKTRVRSANQTRRKSKQTSGSQYEALEKRQLLATLSAGELDPRFGDAGTVATHLTRTFDGRDEAHDGVVQPDGKLLVGGSGHVLRYNINGSLDTTFGDNGATQLEVFEGNGDDGVAAIRLLPNGQILVAGPEEFTRNFIVAKLNSDGSLDASFGENGYARQEMIAGQPGLEAYPSVADLQLTNDNRMIVIGNAYTDDGTSNFYFLATSFNADGSLDPGFGTDGILRLEGFANDSAANPTATQANGKIVAVFPNTVDYNGVVFRFDSNGVIDTSFGASGFADLDFRASNIQLLGNGQIIAAGQNYDSTRLNNNGSVDTSYGVNGYSEPSVAFDSESPAVKLLPSGKLQFVGYGDNDTVDMTVVRVNANGSLDTTFGINGLYTIDSGENDRAYSLVVSTDGSSFLLGEWDDYGFGPFGGGQSQQDFAVAKLTAAGILDASFDGDGFVTTGVVGSYPVSNSAFGVVAQADGKFIVAGGIYSQGDGDVALVRYHANGMVDTTYGDQGVAIVDIGNETAYQFDLTIQSDGKAVVAGPTTIDDADSAFGIARVNTNGTLDSSFGTNGTVVVSADGNIYATSVAVQNDGKIVVGGYGYTNDGRYILTRLNADGFMDKSFGIQFYSGFSGTIQDLAMQGTKIIATGGNNGDAATTLRFNEDGSRDFSFGNNGKAFTNLTNQYERGTEVVVQPDNKIVISSAVRNLNDWAVERYNANGTLDTTFGSNGLFTLDVGGGGNDGDDLNTLALQGDGKIVVGGHSDEQFKVGRINANGTLDTSFGDSGVGTASFDSQRANERVNDVTVLSSGNIVAVGQIDPGWAIAEFLGSETVIDPVAINDAFSTLETEAVMGNLFVDNGFGEDFDYLGQPFTVTQVNGLTTNVGAKLQLPSGARLLVNADGSFAYDPNGQFDYLNDGETSSDVFSYRISTDAVSHDTAVVTVTIEGVTSFAVVADELISDMNTRLNYDASANDTTSGFATYSLFETPQNGTVLMAADGTFSYRPLDGFIGMDHFVYQVIDGADTDFGDVDITVGDQALINDLVAYWSFDQESGDVIDLAPNDKISDNGTLLADAEFTPHGFLDKGISLDGSGDVVRVPTSTEINNLTLTQRTISLWFRANDLPTKGSKQVLYEEGAQTGFNIYLQDGLLYIGVWRNFDRGFNTFINTAPDAIQANQWHHVSLVLDAPKSGLGTITGYLDGQQFAQDDAEHVVAHPAGIGIGAVNGGSAFHDTGRFGRNPSNFNGKIDEVRIYNRALNASEVEALTPANLQDDLTVHWAADEGSGKILSDSSPEGQDNSAQLVGVQYVQGQNGGGLMFDGNGYVDVNNSPDINLAEIQQRTISLNFKADSLGGGRQVLYKQGLKSGFNIYLEKGELVVGGYRNAGRGWQQFFRTSNIQADQWHQVTLVLQSTAARRGTFTVYLDGQQFGSSLAGSIDVTKTSIGLGRLRGGAVFQTSGIVTTEDYLYTGLMDDIRMYNRALTSSEVSALYHRR